MTSRGRVHGVGGGKYSKLANKMCTFLHSISRIFFKTNFYRNKEKFHPQMTGLSPWTTVKPVLYDLSKKAVWVNRGTEGPGVGWNFFYFFHFKIVHYGAFLYTNSKVLFAIKCREKYVIMVFLAIDKRYRYENVKFSSIS